MKQKKDSYFIQPPCGSHFVLSILENEKKLEIGCMTPSKMLDLEPKWKWLKTLGVKASLLMQDQHKN